MVELGVKLMKKLIDSLISISTWPKGITITIKSKGNQQLPEGLEESLSTSMNLFNSRSLKETTELMRFKCP